MGKFMKQTLTFLGVLAVCTGPAAAQTKLPPEARVKAATRLDWEFVARQFGPDQAKMPADYDSTKQRYQLFVPKNYKKETTWPLVLFVSAGDNPGGWPAWRKVCEEQGVLFCAPYGAGNGCPFGQRCRIVLDALDDVRTTYNIDPNRTYVTGFSGGARMACTIGFSLPEYFGGIVPIGGTNPLPKLSYLKHRIHDRLAVAHVAGDTDMNRKEHEEFMHPWWQGIGITSKVWIVPKTGHALPPAELTVQIYQWLESNVKQRQSDAVNNPKLTVGPGQAPTREQQAQRMLEVALASLQKAETVWRGVTLLQGVVARWPASDPGKQAQAKLQEILNDDAKIRLVGEQGGAEERKFLLEQSKALERFGKIQQAIQSWEFLAQEHPNSPEGELARMEAKRLREKK
jgi:poly(3-hydroxybutyrate) depolymerase